MPKLVLVRHGQSEYNLKNLFTGWLDPDLTEQGRKEATHVGKDLQARGFRPAAIFTSNLKRAHQTLDLISHELKCASVPVRKSEALNERHYGDLQGKNKEQTAKEFGEEQVHIWRRSFDVPPPKGESLKDTAARTLPYFHATILPEIKAGKDVLVVAHGNSLRSIVMDIEDLTPEQILKTELATGEARIYDYYASQDVFMRQLTGKDDPCPSKS